MGVLLDDLALGRARAAAGDRAAPLLVPSPYLPEILAVSVSHFSGKAPFHRPARPAY